MVNTLLVLHRFNEQPNWEMRVTFTQIEKFGSPSTMLVT